MVHDGIDAGDAEAEDAAAKAVARDDSGNRSILPAMKARWNPALPKNWSSGLTESEAIIALLAQRR
jgi:hypothetical protein